MCKVQTTYLGTSFGTYTLGSAHFVRFTSGVEIASLFIATICKKSLKEFVSKGVQEEYTYTCDYAYKKWKKNKGTCSTIVHRIKVARLNRPNACDMRTTKKISVKTRIKKKKLCTFVS